MKRILILAATEAELSPIRAQYQQREMQQKIAVDFEVTGIGMVQTAIQGANILAKSFALKAPYDLAINIGLAGSFTDQLPLGKVVRVFSDHLSELGVEDDTDFIPMSKLFAEVKLDSFENLNQTIKVAEELQKVNAITVNTVHGSAVSIANLLKRIEPQVESMEGAAFFMVCEQFGVPSLQIRSISNKVEKRNRGNWKIDLAILNLTSTVIEIINELTNG